MSKFRFIALVVAVVCFTVAYFIPTTEKQDQLIKEAPLSLDLSRQMLLEPPAATINSPVEIVSIPEPEPQHIHYIVKVGDTLSDIFAQFDIPYSTLLQILSVDINHLQLDTIKPGDEIELVFDEERKFNRLIYHISLVEKAIYSLENDDSFSYEFQETEGEWRERLYSGDIQGSFSVSANKIGLTINQVANVTRVLQDKIDFSRSLRAGDKFSILVKQQYLGDHATANSEIKAISFTLSRAEVEAFLAEDGRFYDRTGNSLERAFNRYPVDEKYRRITSTFNPKRKHPVTGRVTPHNGTDFATPVGVPVYSTGDGKVIALRKHPYAGYYLVIEHNSVYKTRYLHLSKFLVKKGETVKRGQQIALAGATGRLTGPHLHFEVLVRNRAVDPMKADLPIATSLQNHHKPAFLARVSEFDALINELN